MSAVPPATEGYKRDITLLGAISIGIGGMVGGGIFAVLGLAATQGGGGTPLAFLIGGLVALLTAYSYARLSVTYPSRGGTVIYIDKAFGVDLFTGTANNLLWLGYIVTLALYATAFGNYFLALLNISSTPWILHLAISAAILVPTLLNLFSAGLVSRAETLVVMIKLGILLLVTLFGFSTLDPSRLRLSTWPGLTHIVASGMLIFVAYEGFELIANAAEDAIDYQRTLPRAFYASVLLVILLYVLIALVTVGSLSTVQIQQSADFALAQAAHSSLGQFGFTLVALAALLATFSAINATLYGSARLTYVIATEGELPEILEKRVWNQPILGLLLTAGVALLLANLFDLTSISTMASACFLLIFALVNAANFTKYKETGSSRLVAGLGVAACLTALVVLVGFTLRYNPLNVFILGCLLASALLIETLYIKYLKPRDRAGRVGERPRRQGTPGD